MYTEIFTYFHFLNMYFKHLNLLYLVSVTLGFFDDIFVPSSNLQHPSRFDEAEQVWIWEYDNNGDKHDLFMDQGERFFFLKIL